MATVNILNYEYDVLETIYRDIGTDILTDQLLRRMSKILNIQNEQALAYKSIWNDYLRAKNCHKNF